MDREARQAAVHGAAESWALLKRLGILSINVTQRSSFQSQMPKPVF